MEDRTGMIVFLSHDQFNFYRPTLPKAGEQEIPNAKGYSCDVTKEDDIKATVAAIEKDLGPIDCLIYNAGSGSFKTWEQLSVEELQSAFTINVVGLLVATQAIVPKMIQRGSGSVLITGATAALRGKPFTAGFAAVKGAQRNFLQSLAKDVGPKGVHVAYFIIDGLVGRPDVADDSKLNPDHVADTYWHVSRQPKTCWSFETDVRPSVENW